MKGNGQNDEGKDKRQTLYEKLWISISDFPETL